MRLNHLDLPVTDVAAATDFFTSHLGFRLLDMRGQHGLAILQGEGGFVLVFTRRRADEGAGPPDPRGQHIGFLLDSEAAVHAAHARLQSAGLPELPAPTHLRGALLFYFVAPGGILVEVSHREPKHE